MSTVYRVEHGREIFDNTGVLVYEQQGELIDVAGEAMVRLAHGTIVPRDKWHDTKAEAFAAAAREFQRLENILANQAGHYRHKAGDASGQPVEDLNRAAAWDIAGKFPTTVERECEAATRLLRDAIRWCPPGEALAMLKAASAHVQVLADWVASHAPERLTRRGGGVVPSGGKPGLMSDG